MSGKAFLVGAGPGNPDLITVRGLKLLQSADVVVYDRLIASELLHHARADAELIFVGKKMAKHTVPQWKINQLLVARVRAGQMVVRLKGGDPFVFGRGGEEALALANAGLPFEIVPGVSAAIAAPAYAGIPVTHRGVARAFAVITGHHASGLPKIDTDWRVFNNIPTLVILMGVKRIQFIVDELLAAGRSPDTPAMVVQSGGTPAQKTVRAELASLPQAIADADVASPAVIVIGEVVRLAETLDWFASAACSPQKPMRADYFGA